MNLTSEMYFSLSGVGADFWELVEQETSFDAAVQALLDRYDVSADVLRSDLRLLADELFAQGLIEETEAQR